MVVCEMQNEMAEVSECVVHTQLCTRKLLHFSNSLLHVKKVSRSEKLRKKHFKGQRLF